jgi:hypothetical protein
MCRWEGSRPDESIMKNPVISLYGQFLMGVLAQHTVVLLPSGQCGVFMPADDRFGNAFIETAVTRDGGSAYVGKDEMLSVVEWPAGIALDYIERRGKGKQKAVLPGELNVVSRAQSVPPLCAIRLEDGRLGVMLPVTDANEYFVQLSRQEHIQIQGQDKVTMLKWMRTLSFEYAQRLNAQNVPAAE